MERRRINGKEMVIAAVSGGLDVSVQAELVHKAFPGIQAIILPIAIMGGHVRRCLLINTEDEERVSELLSPSDADYWSGAAANR